jgi:NAD(P)-dependent dehydrogenase (short-subunit alcohol dehydrogenase family)
MEIFSLDGKNALIIGGSKGLGKGIASGLSLAGANVVISSRNQKDIDAAVADINAAGKGKAIGIPVDICSIGNIRQYVKSCVQILGHIDILINSAGVNVRKHALEFTEEDWDVVTNTQLKYVFFMCQSVAQHMLENKIKGKIINIASLTSILGLKNMVAYCSSKGGIVQMTKALANELATCGICVNAIGPGYYETEMTKPLFKDPAMIKRFEERIPMQRIGLPADLQ